MKADSEIPSEIKEAYNKYMRLYRKNNPDKNTKACRNNYMKNLEKRKAYARDYYQKKKKEKLDAANKETDEKDTLQDKNT